MGLKKVLASILGAALLATSLSGCGSSASTTNIGDEETPKAASAEAAKENLKHEDLTLYLVGDKPDQFDDIYVKVNEILGEKLNTTLKVEWLNWGEHDTKYPLLFSSGEDFDLIFTATTWCHFEETVSMGGFLPISEDMLKTYAPDAYEIMPQEAWDQATIDGKIYMLPSNFVEVTPEVVALRGDYLKKYGYDDITSYEQLEEFYKKCAADGMYADTNTAPLQYLWVGSLGYSTTSGTPECTLFLYNANDPTDTEYKYMLGTKEFSDFCHDMKEMADAGCWPSDILSNSVEAQDGLLSGRAVGMHWNSGTCKIYANQVNAEHPDWDVNIYNINTNYGYGSTKFTNGGIGINVNSKDPERAIMVWNELLTNPDLQDLTQCGIKDVNWKPVGDDKYVVTENPYSPSNWWGWRNMNIMRKQTFDNPTACDTKVEQIDEYTLNHRRDPHPLDGFSFDPTPVTTQVAAVQAALPMYYNPLINGLVDDVDASLAEFENAMNAAGMQDIIKEIQRQIDEYLAKK